MDLWKKRGEKGELNTHAQSKYLFREEVGPDPSLLSSNWKMVGTFMLYNNLFQSKMMMMSISLISGFEFKF